MDTPARRFHPSKVARLVGPAVLLAVALGAAPATAQPPPDHLQCFKVTDALLRRVRATVDLDAPSLGVAPGCRLSAPKLYCVPARQSVQAGTLFDGGRPLAELPYHGPAAATDRICYDVTCPRPHGTAPDRTVVDRFGVHALRRLETEMVCTPATGGTMPPPAEGFQVTSPPITVEPGQDVTWCWYFRTPNQATLAVKRFASQLGPAARGVVFFTTTENGRPAERRPAGDVSIAGCELYTGTTRPNWRYAGYGASDALDFPTDDGQGRPVAMEIEPTSAGVLMMHFKNEGTTPVTSRVTLAAEGLDDPIYTPTATLLSYDATIAIPAYGSGYGVMKDCAVPAGAQFWSLTTFAHKRAVHTAVIDGQDVPFASTDYAQPGRFVRTTPPFLGFAAGAMRTQCAYESPLGFIVRTGPSQQSDEQCLGIGYFFPGTTPRLCHNGYVL